MAQYYFQKHEKSIFFCQYMIFLKLSSRTFVLSPFRTKILTKSLLTQLCYTLRFSLMIKAKKSEGVELNIGMVKELIYEAKYQISAGPGGP